MNDLTIFNYQDTEVRTVVIDGEPWFVLTDLCRVLELSNSSMVASRLNEADLSTTEVRSGGQNRTMYVANESGMYEVVFMSRKPEAAAFRRWITSEVLPSIRKTGSYQVQSQFELPQTYSEALRAHAREVEAREAMESYARELEPAADAYKAFMDGDGSYSVGNVAKMLGMSQNKLFDELRGRGIMIAKGAMRNTPYQRYMHHFAVKAFDYSRHDGTTGTSYTTRVQPSGVEFIRRKLGLRPVETEAA